MTEPVAETVRKWPKVLVVSVLALCVVGAVAYLLKPNPVRTSAAVA